MDENTSNPYVLNDFYEAQKDDFTRGFIRFPLYNLSEGEHSITLKVWDVFNNSSEAKINFIVTDANDLSIEKFITYPNPFSSSTDIYFEHNKVNQELDFSLEIYSLTGTLVKRMEQKSFYSEGYRIGPIRWNGRDRYGTVVSAGIYLAKIAITSEDGDFASKSIRIILLP